MQVSSGTRWLTCEQIDELRGTVRREPCIVVAPMAHSGRMFAIAQGGVDCYPRYGMETWGPLVVIATVLRIFDGYAPTRVVAWFESTNGYLGGRRPRELVGLGRFRVPPSTP